MTFFLDLCTAVGFLSLSSIGAILVVLGWFRIAAPRIHAAQHRFWSWRATRKAIVSVIDESRSYLTRPACRRYHGTGKIDVRNGVMSDFCRHCGQPYGAHHRVSA